MTLTREILIVEDDAIFRNAIKYTFVGDDYTFFEAASVLEGVKTLRTEPGIRVIILDLSLGEGDAKDFLEYLKAEPSKYRVIVLTGHEELLHADSAITHRVFNYLPKAQTFSVHSLRFSIERAFSDIEREFLSRKSARVAEIQSLINSNRGLTEVLQTICQSVLDLVAGYTCHIRVYDLSKGDFWLAAFSGPSDKMRVIFERPKERGQFYFGSIAREWVARTFDDLRNDQEFIELKRSMLNGDRSSEEMRQYFHTIRSAYVVPVLAPTLGHEVDAVLNISSASPAYFTDETREIVDEFATHAALAITNNRLQSKSRNAFQDYSQISQMLERISYQLSSTGTLESIYDVVLDGIANTLNPETVAIFLFNDKTGTLQNVAELRGNERVRDTVESYLPGENLTGAVYEKGLTIRIPAPESGNLSTPAQDSRSDFTAVDAYLPSPPSGRLEHYLGVPISMGGRTVGVLRVINKKSEYYDTVDVKNNPLSLLARGFTGDSQHTLEVIANHVAVAIRNAQLVNELSYQVGQLTALDEVGRLISSELHIDELLKLTIEAAAIVMRAEICMLFLKNDAGDKIVLRQCYGMPRSILNEAYYEIGEGLTGSVVSQGRSLLISKTGRNDGKFDHEILNFLRDFHQQETQIESIIIVPIFAKDTILGVIKVINTSTAGFQYDNQDLRFFEIFASYVGIAIENAHIYDITNQRLAVAERNATLSHMVRAVAHEINNTSGVIPANVDGIKAELNALTKFVDNIRHASCSITCEHQPLRSTMASSRKQINDMLEVIEDSAMQAVDFANEIAGFSASRSGARKVMDINGVIAKAIAQFSPELARNGAFARISLVTELLDTPIYCSIYAAPFIQIVRNMVLNAYQAMELEDEGVLTISTNKDDSRRAARLEFRDNGCGISDSDARRIFDPDFTTKERGNGLGLWLIKNHLEDIGGIISVESTQNEGTRFSIEIPLSGRSKIGEGQDEPGN